MVLLDLGAAAFVGLSVADAQFRPSVSLEAGGLTLFGSTR